MAYVTYMSMVLTSQHALGIIILCALCTVCVEGKTVAVYDDGSVEELEHVCTNGSISFTQGDHLWCCPGFFKRADRCHSCQLGTFMRTVNDCDDCQLCRACDDAKENGNFTIQPCTMHSDTVCSPHQEERVLPSCGKYHNSTTVIPTTTTQTANSQDPYTKPPGNPSTGRKLEWWGYFLIALACFVASVITVCLFCLVKSGKLGSCLVKKASSYEMTGTSDGARRDGDG